MGADSRGNEAIDLVSVCRHKLEGILGLHQVRAGSRLELNGFLSKLRHDRYFAMDFWDLMESLGGRIPAGEVQRTVVEFVAGERVDEGDPALTALAVEFGLRDGHGVG